MFSAFDFYFFGKRGSEDIKNNVEMKSLSKEIVFKPLQPEKPFKLKLILAQYAISTPVKIEAIKYSLMDDAVCRFLVKEIVVVLKTQ